MLTHPHHLMRRTPNLSRAGYELFEKLRALPPLEFENWAVIALGGIPNKVQVGDMGVDGRIFPVGTKPTDSGLFSDDWFPIQVKQMDKVGRPDIDARSRP